MQPKLYKFKTTTELYDLLEKMGHSPNEEPVPVYNISRTPLESIWPATVTYKEGGHQQAEYQSLGFGDDVNTPNGPLPEVILLLRLDIAEKLELKTQIGDRSK